MKRKASSDLKKILIIYVCIVAILIISCIVVYTAYNKKVKESAKQSLIASEKISELVPNDLIEETTSELSKSIKEAMIENNKEEEVENNEEEKIEEVNKETEIIENEDNTEEIEEPEIKKELNFMYPLEGEIIKEYSMDNLIFSETLQEWVVHRGIDIKAPRTTVVKSAEEGMIQSIKNDPRYGLTIIIEHTDNFKTIYSNLLTTEFVHEGQEVEKGQSLGTVGNSATFEIADEPHLHFEMQKDEEYVDPTLYLK